MKATDLMSTPVVTVTPEATLQDVAALMVQRQIGSVVVVDPDGRAAGIVTERSFAGRQAAMPFSRDSFTRVFGKWMDANGLERLFAETSRLPVRDALEPLSSVDEGASIEDVVRVMLDADINHVAVLAGGKPIGVISRRDLLRLFLRQSVSPPA